VGIINIDIFLEQKITHGLIPFGRRMGFADSVWSKPDLKTFGWGGDGVREAGIKIRLAQMIINDLP
ncbi:MAG TPA: hypothetical protein PKY64_06830, partial [Anaerolineaceae bacterium]|nr:hypothetical protein [Anaerolineaceae bacterium]